MTDLSKEAREDLLRYGSLPGPTPDHVRELLTAYDSAIARAEAAEARLDALATALEAADLSVEGTEFQVYSRGMFQLPKLAKAARAPLRSLEQR